MENIRILIPLVALVVGFFALYFTYKAKTQKYKIREMELQKEILELEIQKQKS
jgi:hypothetical protein